MSLTLHFHPLSSFCWKVLVGLYELDVPFEKNIVDLSDDQQRAALTKLWPMTKLPVLTDDARGVTVAESTVILEYVDSVSARAGGPRLIPSDPDAARECRLRDRFFDLYVSMPVQKIVGDRLRAAEARDAHGVVEAKAQLTKAYAIVEQWIASDYAVGSAFSMADCAACPALFYAQKVHPFGNEQRNLSAYLSRLTERPSFARVLEEAKPYFAMFPQ